MNSRRDFKYIVIGGSLLSLNAAFVNAVFLMSTMQVAVAHVTGTITKASIDISKGLWQEAAVVVGLWGSFYLGAILSGGMITSNQFALGHAYGRALLVISMLLCVSGACLTHDWSTIRLMSMGPAAMAMGMQNAMTTKFSGAVIRTTHITGLTTDMGILTANWLQGHEDAPTWRFKLYIPQLAMFVAGGVLGGIAFMHWGPGSLFLPAGFSGLLGLSYVLHLARRFHRSFVEILTRDTSGVLDGTSSWMYLPRYRKQQSSGPPPQTVGICDSPGPTRAAASPANHEKAPLLRTPAAATPRYIIDENNPSPRIIVHDPHFSHNANTRCPLCHGTNSNADPALVSAPHYDYSEYENCPDHFDMLLSNAAFGPRNTEDWYTELLYFERHGRPLPRSRTNTPISRHGHTPTQ